MTGDIDTAIRVVLIGVGATAVMDAWGLLMNRLRVPTPDFALVGRWAGHLARGRWSHPSIAKATPVPGERALGWALHYGIGVAFAALLVALAGTAWTRNPSLWPALGVGLGTVGVPLFVVQPAMGAGIASSRTATPVNNCLRSVANHTTFGVGLYLAAVAVAAAWR
jgi:Protein of unknown function (DUF2938)